jgi:hypothetical protein
MNTPNKKPIKENFTSNYDSKTILMALTTLLATMGFYFIILKYIFQFSSKSALVISFILALLGFLSIIFLISLFSYKPK